ncbi:MAG TPA: tetratricopeptide repeat protein [Allosphingosinicella sp.]|nr:tetratricopeptide repeat protein [Allosphingosinicella sp.]
MIPMRFVCVLAASAALAAPATLPANPPSGSAPGMSAPQGDPAAEYRKGIEALQAQRYADARKAFDKVLAVAPADANTNFLAGLASAGLSDLKAARKFYERAVRADKDLIAARRELGLTYAKLGDPAKAQAQLDALKAMQAKCAAACAKAAEIDASVQALGAAIGAPPSARLETGPSLLFASAAAGDRFYLDAVALINEGRYEAAIASLEAARATFGPHPDVLTYLGFANRKLGRYDLAEVYYRAALAAAPHHKAATEYYGELKIERGDLAGARRLLADLEATCTFGCAEADELKRWIDAGRAPAR